MGKRKERDQTGEKTVSLFSAMGRAKTVSCMWRSDHRVNHLNTKEYVERVDF